MLLSLYSLFLIFKVFGRFTIKLFLINLIIEPWMVSIHKVLVKFPESKNR